LKVDLEKLKELLYGEFPLIESLKNDLYDQVSHICIQLRNGLAEILDQYHETFKRLYEKFVKEES